MYSRRETLRPRAPDPLYTIRPGSWKQKNNHWERNIQKRPRRVSQLFHSKSSALNLCVVPSKTGMDGETIKGGSSYFRVPLRHSVLSSRNFFSFFLFYCRAILMYVWPVLRNISSGERREKKEEQLVEPIGKSFQDAKRERERAPHMKLFP